MMIGDMYCPHCDIRYQVKLNLGAEREDLIKAQICYRCGGPAGEYQGELMSTTEEIFESEQFFDEPENLQILSIHEQINKLAMTRSITASEKDNLKHLLGILEEDRQILEYARTEEVPVFEIAKNKLKPPFFEEF